MAIKAEENFKFTSKYDYIKSLQEKFGLNDEECNTFLWILDMWDKKKETDYPEDFKLTDTGQHLTFKP